VTNNSPNNFKTSSEGLKLIKKQEGLMLDAYQNVVSGVRDKVTIGYGHTGLLFGKPLKLGDKITQSEAEILFRNDLKPFERVINESVKVQINQNQFDALMSLTYNIGPNAFKNSTLLKLLNQGDFEGANKEFTRWNKVGGGTISTGLTRRRTDEASLFNKPFSGSTGNNPTKTLQGGVEYNDYRGNNNLQPSTPTGNAAPLSQSQISEHLKELLKNGKGLADLIPDTSSRVVLNGKAVINDYLRGQSSGGGLLSGEDFYHPATKMVNYDPTQRFLIGSVTKNQDAASLPPVASLPFGREEPFTTPNLTTIQQVLNRGYDYGVQNIKGYLRNRAGELIFGKKFYSIIRKVNSIRNYASMAMSLAKIYAKSSWNASAALVQALASPEWQSAAKSILGDKVGGYVAKVGEFAGNIYKTVTSIPVIGNVIKYIFGW